MQNFTLIPNPKAKLKENTLPKSYSQKTALLLVFFKINLYLCPFSHFRLQIWNENKILHILVPILTYFDTKYFFQNTGQFCFSSNRSIWVPKNAEFYAYSKSEDEIGKKWTDKKIILKKLAKKQFFENNFFVMRIFSILPSDLESV